MLLLHLHLSVVHFVFYVQPHFTSCNITSGAGSMVVIKTGDNPQLPLSIHTLMVMVYIGISNSVIIPDNTRQYIESMLF